MGLIQMSLAGAAMILVIIVLRLLFLNRLPEKMFLILWWAALIRLLLPAAFPSQFSIYSLLPVEEISAGRIGGPGEWGMVPASGFPWLEGAYPEGEGSQAAGNAAYTQDGDVQAGGSIAYAPAGESGQGSALEAGENKVSSFLGWPFVWAAGMLFSAGFFLLAYLRGIREFGSSFPVEEEKIKGWGSLHRGRRKILVRWSERIQTPLSYGIVHPVILMPKDTDWDDGRQLAYVLEHEYVHIRRYDAVTKLILTAALCVHWFNPLVWAMYFLFNRDLEISCDGEVVRHFGEEAKSGYARTLISMEEKKAGFMPLCNGFGKNAIGKSAIEERIKAVMKIKKNSAIALAAAALLIAAVVLAFGTTAKAGGKEQKEYLKAALGSAYTEKECEMLADLWIDGYGDMTVAAYRDKMAVMTDTPKCMSLIEDFSQTDWVFETDDKEGGALDQYFRYYDYVFDPLCGDNWAKREFSSAVICREGQAYPIGTYGRLDGASDTAVFEYVLTLLIEDPEKLTTAQYRDTRLQAEKDLEEIFRGKAEAELADGKLMDQYLEKETKRIARERSGANLTVAIEYFFLPLEHEGAKEGQIPDNERGKTGETPGAQPETADMPDGQIKVLEDREKRRYSSADPADYDSLLALMKPDYESMSVADFDDKLLAWSNEDYDRMERISEDVGLEEYGVQLTQKEKSFVELTFGLSGEENHRLINNMRADVPQKEEDVRYGWISQDAYKSSDDGLAWVNFWYCFYWYITDRDELTVGERDAGIRDFMEEVQKTLFDTDLDELLAWEAEDLVLLLKETAEKYSNNLLRIEIAQENVSVEHMDERELAAEREWQEMGGN